NFRGASWSVPQLGQVIALNTPSVGSRRQSSPAARAPVTIVCPFLPSRRFGPCPGTVPGHDLKGRAVRADQHSRLLRSGLTAIILRLRGAFGGGLRPAAESFSDRVAQPWTTRPSIPPAIVTTWPVTSP